jgi:dihydroorotate dehydrogenase (NAD+) catalytic subunit
MRTPTVRVVKPAIRPATRPATRPVAPKQRGPAELGPTGSALPVAGGPGSRRGAAIEAVPQPALDALGGRPVDLEVDLGRGLVLPNPVIAAAGPFGYGVEVADLVDLDRLGGIVTRGTSLKPRAGHPGTRLAEVPAGLLVGVGMQNPGIDAVLDRYATTWAKWPVPVIINLCGESAGDLAEIARRLEGAPGVAGIELNLSCGGGGRGGIVFAMDADAAASAVSAVRRATDLPIIAKLSAAAADIRSVARSVEAVGADAISAINTLPGFLPASDRRGAALGSGYGGICGPALKPIALRVVYEIAQVVDVPIIGIGGVCTLDDALDLLACGASAVGVGVAALADPMLPVRLADELADACRARGVTSVSDLVGTALPPKAGAPSTRGAEHAR